MPGRLINFRKDSSSPPSSEMKSKIPSALKAPNLEDRRHSMDALKRHKDKDKKTSSRDSLASSPKPAKLNILIESPPLVFYGASTQSTGALFSGQLQVDVNGDTVTFEKFDMILSVIVTARKPVEKHCPDCSTRTTELKRWCWIKEQPLKLKRGMHSFPCQHLLPGHLPATSHGLTVSVDYRLAVEATTSTGEFITFGRTIDVKRAMFPVPASEKNSMRVFPPTNLTAKLTLPQAIHPIGDINIEFRLFGITTKQESSQTRWILKKLMWRLEEYEKTVSPVCPKHAAKVGGQGKGILHEEMKQIGQGEVDKFKTDLDAGNIEGEFRVAVNPLQKPICDVDSGSGFEVHHKMIVEMIIAEEWASTKKPHQATPTGAARVLKTNFKLILTERSGLGISWDEEMPPVYEDVPASPPTYIFVKDIDPADLDGSDCLRLG